MNHVGAKTIFAALMVIALAVGCDTDYDATSGLETDKEEQVTSQNDTSTTEESYSENARNPGVEYADPNYSSIYDNEQPERVTGARTDNVDMASMEKTIYFSPDLATLTQAEAINLKRFAETIQQQDISNMQIVIESYAASNSTEEYDRQLSVLRAETVQDFLQSEGVEVANWELQTLSNGQLSEPGAAMDSQGTISGQAGPGAGAEGNQPSADDRADDRESNKVVISLSPYNERNEIGSIN